MDLIGSPGHSNLAFLNSEERYLFLVLRYMKVKIILADILILIFNLVTYIL